MASSDGLDGCLLRSRSQSDPNMLTESAIDLVHSAGKDPGLLLLYIFIVFCGEEGIFRYSVFFVFFCNAAVLK